MEKKVLVETSARHVHVTREALDILFGEGYELTVKKELSQPGQFASNERVAVIGLIACVAGLGLAPLWAQNIINDAVAPIIRHIGEYATLASI